jgi:hypothetical protein
MHVLELVMHGSTVACMHTCVGVAPLILYFYLNLLI